MICLIYVFVLAAAQNSTQNLTEAFCENGGAFSEEGLCLCPQGFEGDTCQFKQCVNGYRLFGTGPCNCDSYRFGGWQGDLCDVPLCLHDAQFLNNSCQCPDGYSGRFCESVTRCEHGTLGGYGDTAEKCICFDKSKYSGDFCDKIVCNNGVTSGNDSCECHEKYYGKHCNLGKNNRNELPHEEPKGITKIYMGAAALTVVLLCSWCCVKIARRARRQDPTPRVAYSATATSDPLVTPSTTQNYSTVSAPKSSDLAPPSYEEAVGH